MSQKREHQHMHSGWEQAESAPFLLQMTGLDSKIEDKEKTEKKVQTSFNHQCLCEFCQLQRLHEGKPGVKEKFQPQCFQKKNEKKILQPREQKLMLSSSRQEVQLKRQQEIKLIYDSKVKIEEILEKDDEYSGKNMGMKDEEKLNCSFDEITESLKQFLISDKQSEENFEDEKVSMRRDFEYLSEKDIQLHSPFPSSLFFNLDHVDAEKNQELLNSWSNPNKQAICDSTKSLSNYVSWNTGEKLFKMKPKALTRKIVGKRCFASRTLLKKKKLIKKLMKKMMKGFQQKSVIGLNLDFCSSIEGKQSSVKITNDSWVQVGEEEKGEKL